MCGIVGICSRNKKSINDFPIKNSMSTISHRGPDERNFKKLNNAVFGHLRLSIIGVNSPKAKQPSYDKNHMLIFNGEIYNYFELKELLKKKKINCTGESDTEVLFLCLVNFGIEETLKKIDGMFAFAFFDNIKKKLFLARDRVGEKFIYWLKDKNALLFASEIKTLVNIENTNVEPNLTKMNEIFFHGKVYGDETLFKDIYELEPGSYLEYNINSSKIKKFTYWNLENFKNIKLSNSYIEEFGNVFSHAVKSRMTSDVPIGSLISGGIDSSSLVQTIFDLEMDHNLSLFFYEASTKEFNEKEDVKLFIDNIESKYPLAKIRLHTVKRNKNKFLKEYNKMTYFNDEPLTFNNFHLVSDLTKKAKENNIKVVFSGEGVDELLFGYDRFHNTSKIINEIKDKEKRMENIYFGSGLKNIDIIKNINNKGASENYQDSCSWKYLKKIINNFDTDTSQILFSQKYRLIGLLQRQDRAAMANSVESRAPFLAPNFFSWINGLPINAKRNIKNKKNKMILREYMSQKIPKEIINKKKIGFLTDFDLWVKSKNFINILKKKILKENSFSSSFLNMDLIKKILELSPHKIKDYFYVLFSIYTIECWFDVFFKEKKKAFLN